DDGRLVHADDLGAVEQLQAVAAGGAGQERLDLGLVADEHHAQLGVGCDGLHRTGDDRPRGVVAPPRVPRDPHGLLLLFHRHLLAALVEAAVGADAVRQLRLVALRAVLDLQRLEVLVAAALPLSRVRRSSLRNGHDRMPFRGPGGKTNNRREPRRGRQAKGRPRRGRHAGLLDGPLPVRHYDTKESAKRPARAGEHLRKDGRVMEILWAPWRHSYVAAVKPPAAGDPCFICEGLAGADDRATHLVQRTPLSVVFLNRYPYNNGHLLVA